MRLEVRVALVLVPAPATDQVELFTYGTDPTVKDSDGDGFGDACDTCNLVADLTVTGILAGDTTWSGVVLMTGDVTIPAGVSLTIMPGTIVMAESYTDDQGGGNQPSLVSIEVLGTLNARGTAAAPTHRGSPAIPSPF